jgi:hypothetical protein
MDSGDKVGCTLSLLCRIPPSAQNKKGTSMTDEKVLMTLILDKDTVVADAPCAGATLIAQYPDGYFALAITAGGTCVFGLDGEPPVSIGITDLIDLFRVKSAESLQ